MESNMVEAKQRHWCPAAWLILMIIANSVIVSSILMAMTIKSSLPNAPQPWAMFTLAGRYLAIANVVIATANVVFLVALFQWKKWGFFGFVGSTILVMVIGLTIGKPIGRVLLQVLWVVILYAVLQIGKEKRGWTQLE